MTQPTAAGDNAVAPCLRVEGLSRAFGATQALNDVSLDVRPGRIHALLGGNGSGKSTLIKILAGTHTGDAGLLRVGPVTLPATAANPAWSAAHGLRFVHQDLGLFDDLSVADNLVAGRGYPRRRGRVIDGRAVHRQALRALARVGLELDPTTSVADLRPAQRTMLAIARALWEEPTSVVSAQPVDADSAGRRIIVLDEPTAALPVAEADLLFQLLRTVRNLGDAIIFVSHRLGEVAAIADEATVLRDGAVIARMLHAGEIDSGVLHRLMNAHTPDARTRTSERPRTRTKPVARLAITNLHCPSVRVDRLVLDPGEVVGVVSLTGGGSKELLATVVGARPGRGTSVTKDEAPLKPRGVHHAVRRGIGYVPADRQQHAAFLDQNVADNLLVASLRPRKTVLGLSDARLRRAAGEAIDRYGIKTAGPDAPLGSLSGGNQQKVVLARWLERRSDLLLLDEPTQGVDVAARTDIWDLIHEATRRGVSVLLASTDLDEVAEHCDRVLIMRDGAVEQKVTATTGDRLAQLLYADTRTATVG